MKFTSIKSLAYLALILLCGCGGGGGGGPAGPPPGSITISGVAAKGPINGGDVKVFAVNPDGTFDRTLDSIGSGKTSSDGTGSYAITILVPPADRPVVIEVTGGTYTDEASGTENVALTTPLRAVVPKIVDGSKIAVTPYTELAYKKAEGTGTNAGVITFNKSTIDDANTSIAKLYGLDDIITTLPFDPANAAAAAGATDSQKKYAVALGAFSQMSYAAMLPGGSLDTATKTLLEDLGSQVFSSAGIEQTSLDSYNTAAAVFNGSDKNKTGTQAALITFSAGVLTLSTTGSLPTANVINAIDFTVILPAGVTVAANVDGDASGAIVPSSNAVNNSFPMAVYTPATLSAPGTLRVVILNAQPGFGIGEFMHINFLGYPVELRPESFVFSLNGSGVVGGNAGVANSSALPGIGLSVSNLKGIQQ